MTRSRRRLRLGRALGVVGAVAVGSFAIEDDARGFPHVVSQGETLAQIAIAMYGTPRFETALVGANALDSHGGSAIVAGMPIEVPAPAYARVREGDTWYALAKTYLGEARRAETLARANGAVSWEPPAQGQEIVVPAVIAHIVAERETMGLIAQRYLNDVNRAWILDAYNGRPSDRPVARGEIVLVPLLDLALTEEGKKAARLAAERTRTEGGGQTHELQRHAEAELPPLHAAVRAGHYVEAVAKGNLLLGSGALTRPQIASIHRALLEAYVALGEGELAHAACAAWRAHSAGAIDLDPHRISPKIRVACTDKPPRRPVE